MRGHHLLTHGDRDLPTRRKLKHRVPLLPEKGTPMHAPNTISVDKLVRLVGTPKCPTLIDVRAQNQFEADPHLIPSSSHRASEELEVWSEVPGGHAAVVICETGASASQ